MITMTSTTTLTDAETDERARNARHLRALRGSWRGSSAPEGSLTVRPLGDADHARVARLAALDSRLVPQGRLLGAETAGALVAAMSLDTGETIADPFRRSTEARELLAVRARQLQAAEGGSHGRRLLGSLRVGHARAAVTGSATEARGTC